MPSQFIVVVEIETKLKRATFALPLHTPRVSECSLKNPTQVNGRDPLYDAVPPQQPRLRSCAVARLTVPHAFPVPDRRGQLHVARHGELRSHKVSQRPSRTDHPRRKRKLSLPSTFHFPFLPSDNTASLAEDWGDQTLVLSYCGDSDGSSGVLREAIRYQLNNEYLIIA